MRQVLVRSVEPRVVGALRDRAKRRACPLQSELRAALDRVATMTKAEACAEAAKLRQRLAGRTLLDSVSLLQEDRDR